MRRYRAGESDEVCRTPPAYSGQPEQGVTLYAPRTAAYTALLPEPTLTSGVLAQILVGPEPSR